MPRSLPRCWSSAGHQFLKRCVTQYSSMQGCTSHSCGMWLCRFFYERLRKHKGENEWVTWTWQWGLKEKSEKQIKKRRRWSQGREAVNHEEPLKKLKDLFPGARVLLSSTWLTQTAQLSRGEKVRNSERFPGRARQGRDAKKCFATTRRITNLIHKLMLAAA